MKKNYILLLLFLMFACQMYGQVPVLPIKDNLTTTLLTNKGFTNATAFDTIVLPYNGANEFTLEVKAQVNSAIGRGLDVQFGNIEGNGLRTSLDKLSFNNTTALPSIQNLSASADNSQLQTYRYAVKDGFATIYQNGYFLDSKALSVLIDENAVTVEKTYGTDNFLGKWAGTAGNNSGKPSDYGWANPAAVALFNTANSTSGVRYLDVTAGHVIESSNTNFSGRLMYIRWDGDAYVSSTYSFPIQLESKLDYEFSWLYEYISNAAPGAKINVAIATAADGTGVIASKTFITGNANKLREGKISFNPQVGGTYYITITGDRSLFGIANLNLKSTNIINNWDGLTASNSGKPSDYQWSNTAGISVFGTANSTAGTRYMDVTSGHSYEFDNTTFSGRLLYIRWDNTTFENSVYALPVALDQSKQYKFSWLYEYLANAAAGAKIKVSIGTMPDGSGVIASKEFISGNSNKLRAGDLSFQVSNGGTYYITLTGDWALFGIGNLKMVEQKTSKIVIGKNYATGSVNMNVTSVTYDTLAYAPAQINAVPIVPVVLNTPVVTVNTYANSKVSLNSNVSLHLTNSVNPLINSNVEMNSVDSRLYFDTLQPSLVIDTFLQYVTVNGVPAQNNVNVYVSSSGIGTLVLPHSSDFKPLEVFTGENFSGSSQQYAIVTPNSNLGTFDNTIKSFKLKRGYMATFATNTDGTGYSRVYRADNQDLEISVLPVNLKATISFLRTMRLNEVTKKGLASGTTAVQEALNISWFYNWNTGLNTTAKMEYVPIRQNAGWPSFDAANTKEGYTHLLGYNEPDRPDQSNMTVDAAINGWPGLMQSGLRVGSPCTSDPFNPWLNNFMVQAEAKNYRVDYMVLHCYWYKSAAQWKTDLQSIYDKYKRPIWITEWNIGANWTANNFPDGPIVLTDANATKHKNDLAAVLQVLEDADYVERYSLYNWVQDARALFVTIDDAFKTRNPNWANYVWLQNATVVTTATTGNTVLTPAGAYYAKLVSKKAYNPAKEYISTWTTIVEKLTYNLNAASTGIVLKWTGANSELVNKYVVERKLSGEADFSVFYESTDYTKLNVNDAVHSVAQYRIKVIGKDNVSSAYSSVLTFTQDTTPVAPANLSGVALSINKIDLLWKSVNNANSYNLKRSNSQEGVYQTIAAYTKDTIYSDSGLSENTTYYYKVAAVNTGGESVDSAPITIKTKLLGIPDKVSGVLLGSGDGQVKLKWNFIYDAQFYVKRATSLSGPFTTIATVSTTDYKDLSKTNGVIYYYKVAAFTAVGEGVSSDVVTATPNLGQLAYYNFEENSGTIAKDIWGNYTGSLGVTNTWGTGHTGSALYFDGTASSYLDIEDGVMEGLNDFTVTTWVYFNSLSNWTRIFDFGDNTGSWMTLEAANGSGKLSYEITNGGLKNSLNSQYAAPLNQWIKVTLRQEGDVCKIIVDGIEVASGPITIKPSALGKTAVNYLGKSKYASDPYLNGRIDDFMIYNYALSTSSQTSKISGKDKVSNIEVISEAEDLKFYTSNSTLYSVYIGTKSVDYSLYDISGRPIKTGKLNANVETNLGLYNNGIYIIIVDDGLTIKSTKVIVK